MQRRLAHKQAGTCSQPARAHLREHICAQEEGGYCYNCFLKRKRFPGRKQEYWPLALTTPPPTPPKIRRFTQQSKPYLYYYLKRRIKIPSLWQGRGKTGTVNRSKHPALFRTEKGSTDFPRLCASSGGAHGNASCGCFSAHVSRRHPLGPTCLLISVRPVGSHAKYGGC